MTAVGAGTIVWLLTIDGGLETIGETLAAGLLFTANWLYSVIDAPISSGIINKKYGFTNSITLTPAFSRDPLNPNRVNPGLKLTWSLN